MCGIWGLICTKKFTALHLTNIYNDFNKISSRGPDRSDLKQIKKPNIDFFLGFHRLAIMDQSIRGDQPFSQEYIVDTEKNHPTEQIIREEHIVYAMVNGEIYNYLELIDEYNLVTNSGSDCEVVPELYRKYGFVNMIKLLRGEYAIAVLDLNLTANTFDFYLGRDPVGVRPLFMGFKNGGMSFSSELKGLTGVSEYKNIIQVPNGSYISIKSSMDNLDILNEYADVPITPIKYFDVNPFVNIHEKYIIYDNMLAMDLIRNRLINSVIKRLQSERPLGFLLSGGLDSSLVVSIAADYFNQLGKQIYTFSIGIPGSTDREYAEKVAKHCNTIHQHIEFTEQQFIDAIPDVIECIESYDITTVRASTGQYLVSKWIAQNTDIKVLLIGDGSDELCSGYMYFHNAPSPEESHAENIRLLEELRYYDVLRADRGIAGNGLEARVPYLDQDFVHMYLMIDPKLRVPTYYEPYGKKIEKYLLRMSFDLTVCGKSYLPPEVLWRKKEAFSDGVSSKGRSWYQIIQDNVELLYTNDDLKKYDNEHNKPYTKEALYYREIFEKNYGKTAHTIPHMWLPKWCGNIQDPSARVLQIYNE